MSFSSQVKEELLKQISPARHCRIAEIAAIISFCGRYIYSENQGSYINVGTENLTVAAKYFILLEKTFKTRAEVMVRRSHNNTYYLVAVTDNDMAKNILRAIKPKEHGMVNGLILQNTCCRRAFIRGAFMAAGSITDPAKSYHFEIVAGDEIKAEWLRNILNTFNIECKYTMRKKNCVVYIKEGAQIADILSVMEAHVALMDFENVRIYKEMRNSVNRQVNCEAANISKTTGAAHRQIQDIMYLRDNMNFNELPEHLREVARMRTRYADVSLKELGEMLHPPLGKSGVNHRLRKLSEMASDLRRQKEEMK